MWPLTLCVCLYSGPELRSDLSSFVTDATEEELNAIEVCLYICMYILRTRSHNNIFICVCAWCA